MVIDPTWRFTYRLPGLVFNPAVYLDTRLARKKIVEGTRLFADDPIVGQIVMVYMVPVPLK